MTKKTISSCFLWILLFHIPHYTTGQEEFFKISGIEAQPLLSNALRISEALAFIGQPLPEQVDDYLGTLPSQYFNEQTVSRVQDLLDPFCIAQVDINPESRVKVLRGPAKALLVQDGWSTFLVKIRNQAQVSARLQPESPNSIPFLKISSGAHKTARENVISPGEVDNQFLELQIYRDRPMRPNLSGLELEYAILQIHTREVGKREVRLGFNVGQGSQDLGFRNFVDILFEVAPSVQVVFDVRDEDGQSAMASFIITDGVDRYSDSRFQRWGANYHFNMARTQHWQEGLDEGKSAEVNLPPGQRLAGIYPVPAKRLATHDEYPDFFFQPQIYRTSGEHVYLPPGEYHVVYGRGPEYQQSYQKIVIPEGVEKHNVNFQLERWIHMADLGWYSADHHIHAAGCSHYESPEEGVHPEHMWRQVLGEDLNMGNNLSWGPSWYYQKQFFSGENHPLSDDTNLLRYDVEVSGFPSSHAGHIVLLNLKEDDYPNTTEVEEWPSWTLPVLQWAQSQGGVTGYAHSGWGLAPISATQSIPNFSMPKMDGIGANEYVVTVTHDAVDFYSAGDTPLHYELNMWYHTLNCGFRVSLSGETDFPCISDERVGRARVYAELNEGLNFEDFIDAIVTGRSYVSDGYSHLIDFTVNQIKLGQESSEINVDGTSDLNISVNAAAFLSESQSDVGGLIASLKFEQSPFWHIERARNGSSRMVDVELIRNGVVVEKKEISADGEWNELQFKTSVNQSSWYAIRVLGSSHTNPIYVLVDDQPINDIESAKWCRNAVDQCWKMKLPRIRESEVEEAREAYDHARNHYDQLINGSPKR